MTLVAIRGAKEPMRPLKSLCTPRETRVNGWEVVTWAAPWGRMRTVVISCAGMMRMALRSSAGRSLKDFPRVEPESGGRRWRVEEVVVRSRRRALELGAVRRLGGIVALSAEMMLFSSVLGLM